MIDNYIISTEKNLLDINQIHGWLKNCFWSKNIPFEYVGRLIQYSLCFGVYQKQSNEQVGFGRVISDFTTFAYICDIVIDDLHRKKGLGTALIEAIMDYSDLQGLKTWALRTTEEARKIYEKIGFKVANYPHSNLQIEDLDIYCYQNFVNLYKVIPS